MSVLERRRYPLAFVPDLVAPVLNETDERHFRASLRLGDDSIIVVSDGHGSYRFTRMGSISSPESEVLFEARVAPRISVGFSPVKAQKPEWMVKKLSELGVDIIQPLITARSVVRWERKKRVALEKRLAVAATEAAMQCRSVWLPTIEEPRTVAEVISVSRSHGQPVALADPVGTTLADPQTLVLVGPEGGWSEEEVVAADRVVLPGNILRAETAVIVAGATLAGLRSNKNSGQA